MSVLLFIAKPLLMSAALSLATLTVPDPPGLALQNAAVLPANGWPTAAAVPQRKGFCFNPYTGGLVDVRGIPPGSLVRDPADPDASHKFRVPGLPAE